MYSVSFLPSFVGFSSSHVSSSSSSFAAIAAANGRPVTPSLRGPRPVTSSAFPPVRPARFVLLGCQHLYRRYSQRTREEKGGSKLLCGGGDVAGDQS